MLQPTAKLRQQKLCDELLEVPIWAKFQHVLVLTLLSLLLPLQKMPVLNADNITPAYNSISIISYIVKFNWYF